MCEDNNQKDEKEENNLDYSFLATPFRSTMDWKKLLK